MKWNRYLLLCSVIFALLSCNKKPAKTCTEISFTRAHFPISKKLKGEKIELKDDLNHWYHYLLNDTAVVATSISIEKPGDPFLDIYSLNTHEKCFSAVLHGRGPNEYIAANYLPLKNEHSFILLDQNVRKAAIWNVDSLLLQKENYAPLREIVLTSLSMFKKDSDCWMIRNEMFNIEDPHSKRVIEWNPHREDAKEVMKSLSKKPIHISECEKITLQPSPKTDEYIRVGANRDIIEFYKDSTCYKRLIGPDHVENPGFKNRSQGPMIFTSYRDNKEYISYAQGCATDESLFLVYKGIFPKGRTKESNENEIVELGWDGTLKAHYTTDHPLSTLSITSDGSYFYGTSVNPETELHELYRFKID